MDEYVRFLYHSLSIIQLLDLVFFPSTALQASDIVYETFEITKSIVQFVHKSAEIHTQGNNVLGH